MPSPQAPSPFLEVGIFDEEHLRYPYNHPEDTYGGNPQAEDSQIYDKSRAIALVDYAAAEGFNVFTLGFRDFERLLAYDFIEPGGQAVNEIIEPYASDVADLIRYAANRSLKFCVQTPPMSVPPEVKERFGSRFLGPNGSFCLDKPFTAEILQGKLAEFFRRYPECAGVRLLIDREQLAACQCDCTSCREPALSECLRWIVETARAACVRLGKELQVHVDAVAAGDEGCAAVIRSVVRDGLARSVLSLGFPGMDKSGAHDSIGTGIGDIAQFDCWGRQFGWNEYPCYLGDRFSEQFAPLERAGFSLVEAKATWTPRENFILERPWANAANLYVFRELAGDPARDPDEALRRYIENVFPASAAETAFRLFKESYVLQQTWWMHRGSVVNDDSRIFQRDPERAPTYRERLRQLLVPLFEEADSDCWRDLAERRRRIRAERDRAISIIRDLAGHVPFGWYSALMRGVQAMTYCAQLCTCCLEAQARADGMIDPRDARRWRDLAEEVRTLVREWDEIDPVSYRRFSGGNALDMWAEFQSVRVG